jgi:hypothetical protein
MKKLVPLLALLFIYLLIASRAHGQGTPSLPGLNTDSLKIAAAKEKKEMAALMAKSKLDAMVTRVEGGRFGYYVFVDGKLMIEQKTIPGLAGNKGFASEAEAKKVTELVIQKMKEGEMPPTVSNEDLKRLKISIAQ